MKEQLDSYMAMCLILVTGETIIYLEMEDGKWVEPCKVHVHERDKVSFWPLQAFAESIICEPIDPRHIITRYVPEPAIEESYKQWLVGYIEATRTLVHN